MVQQNVLTGLTKRRTVIYGFIKRFLCEFAWQRVIITTTCCRYFYLYNKYWGAPFELVGHKKPECELPDNCTWVSTGEQLAKRSGATSHGHTLNSSRTGLCGWWRTRFWRRKLLYSHTKQVAFKDYKFVGRADLTTDLMKRPYAQSANCFYGAPKKADTGCQLSPLYGIKNFAYLHEIRVVAIGILKLRIQ